MKLDAVIIHAKELSESQLVCKDCREGYKQLAEWLEELKRNKDKECETSAREMFKKLGYEKQVYDDFIVYVKGNYIMFHIIEFHLKNKIVQSHREDCEIGDVIKSLTVDEFKAIQQQMRELRWF